MGQGRNCYRLHSRQSEEKNSTNSSGCDQVALTQRAGALKLATPVYLRHLFVDTSVVFVLGVLHSREHKQPFLDDCLTGIGKAAIFAADLEAATL